MIVFIDSSILGKICNPGDSPEVLLIQQWFFKLLSRGVRVVSSDICDYEIRRSLLLDQQRNSEASGLSKLDESRELIEFLPVTQAVLFVAAQLWADARMQGQPTASDQSLDADLIICATWRILSMAEPGRYSVIATTNVKHLGRFAAAEKLSAMLDRLKKIVASE
jgi:predicted nucleic acid-binding protein